jgi:uncharacterized protein YecE (DUF72 family)
VEVCRASKQRRSGDHGHEPLEEKRGPLLCQLPPSQTFDVDVFDPAFKAMRSADEGQIVIEVSAQELSNGRSIGSAEELYDRPGSRRSSTGVASG